MNARNPWTWFVGVSVALIALVVVWIGWAWVRPPTRDEFAMHNVAINLVDRVARSIGARGCVSSRASDHEPCIPMVAGATRTSHDGLLRERVVWSEYETHTHHVCGSPEAAPATIRMAIRLARDAPHHFVVDVWVSDATLADDLAEATQRVAAESGAKADVRLRDSLPAFVR